MLAVTAGASQVVRRWPLSKEWQHSCVLVQLPDGQGRVYARGTLDGILRRCVRQLNADGEVEDIQHSEVQPQESKHALKRADKCWMHSHMHAHQWS
jgi:hypothetical protein